MIDDIGRAPQAVAVVHTAVPQLVVIWPPVMVTELQVFVHCGAYVREHVDEVSVVLLELIVVCGFVVGLYTGIWSWSFSWRNHWWLAYW